MALCPGLPGRAGTRKVKRVWISLKQETVSGTGISWAICKFAPCSRQITTPPPLSFLQAECPSCRPTNSIKALKALYFTLCISLFHITHQACPIWLSQCGMLPVIITSGSCSCRFTFAVSLLLTNSCWPSIAPPDAFCNHSNNDLINYKQRI